MAKPTKPVLYRPWLPSAELNQVLDSYDTERTPIAAAIVNAYRTFAGSLDRAIADNSEPEQILALKSLRKLDDLLNLLPNSVTESVNAATAEELAHTKCPGLSLQKIRAIQENKGAPHTPYAIEALEMRLKHHDWHTIAGRLCQCGDPRHDGLDSDGKNRCDEKMRKCLKKLEKDLKEYPEIKAILDKHRK